MNKQSLIHFCIASLKSRHHFLKKKAVALTTKSWVSFALFGGEIIHLLMISRNPRRLIDFQIVDNESQGVLGDNLGFENGHPQINTKWDGYRIKHLRAAFIST